MAPTAKKKKKRPSANSRPVSTVGQNQGPVSIGPQQQTMGSFWTQIGGRKSVRLARKMKKPLKKISICNDIWWNVLPFFDHFNLGLKLAFVSFRFDSLVDKHFNAKTTELTIWKQIVIYKYKRTKEAKLFVRNEQKKIVHQLPKSPLPTKIRFDELRIRYIDHSVITFLRTNKQIFDKGTKLTLDISDERKIWDVMAREILPIFAENVRHLVLYIDNLNNLRRRISPTFLTDLKRLSTIDFGRLLPNATVAKWLHRPTTDGQPKRLRCALDYGPSAKGWINNFKEEFLSATASVCYIVKIEFYFDGDITPIEPFELVNERTREKLTMAKEENDEDDAFVGYCWLLMRCPIGKAVQWEDETLDHLNSVRFDTWGGDSIGPLSSPTEAGPSKEKVF